LPPFAFAFAFTFYKPETAWDLETLGHVYLDQGRFREAEALFERTLSIREAVSPVDDAAYD
jgi:uncharacterized protein HemY